MGKTKFKAAEKHLGSKNTGWEVAEECTAHSHLSKGNYQIAQWAEVKGMFHLTYRNGHLDLKKNNNNKKMHKSFYCIFSLIYYIYYIVLVFLTLFLL